MSIKTKQERIWGNHAVIGITIEMRANDLETGAHGIYSRKGNMKSSISQH